MDDNSSILNHIYDPVKAHQYYEAHKRLQGRKTGAANNDPTTGTSNKNRATALGRNASRKLGPEKTKAVRQLVNQTKAQLDKMTEEFRSWMQAHPKATPQEQEVQRQSVLAKKNEAIKKLKDGVGKITLGTSANKKPSGIPPATEGRHH